MGQAFKFYGLYYLESFCKIVQWATFEQCAQCPPDNVDYCVFFHSSMQVLYKTNHFCASLSANVKQSETIVVT